MKDDSLLGTTALRDRGWTPSMIARYLTDPDKLVKNPHYRSGPPMKLFLRSKVEAAEALPGFASSAKTAASRSGAAISAAEKKRDALLAAVSAMHIQVTVVHIDDLTRRAIASYNDHILDRDWGNDYLSLASEESSGDFLQRISVNYIRHCLTDYDHALEDVAGKVGVMDAVTAIRRKVYAAIAEAYPSLASECRQQMDRRGICNQPVSYHISPEVQQA